MCPYKPRHFKGSRIIRTEVIELCNKEEIDIINN